jgi:hypothetical protein
VIRSLGIDGVRRLVVVNGHFENCWPAVEGVDLALRELRRDGITDMQKPAASYSAHQRRVMPADRCPFQRVRRLRLLSPG